MHIQLVSVAWYRLDFTSTSRELNPGIGVVPDTGISTDTRLLVQIPLQYNIRYQYRHST